MLVYEFTLGSIGGIFSILLCAVLFWLFDRGVMCFIISYIFTIIL